MLWRRKMHFLSAEGSTGLLCGRTVAGSNGLKSVLFVGAAAGQHDIKRPASFITAESCHYSEGTRGDLGIMTVMVRSPTLGTEWTVTWWPACVDCVLRKLCPAAGWSSTAWDRIISWYPPKLPAPTQKKTSAFLNWHEIKSQRGEFTSFQSAQSAGFTSLAAVNCFVIKHNCRGKVVKRHLTYWKSVKNMWSLPCFSPCQYICVLGRRVFNIPRSWSCKKQKKENRNLFFIVFTSALITHTAAI